MLPAPSAQRPAGGPSGSGRGRDRVWEAEALPVTQDQGPPGPRPAPVISPRRALLSQPRWPLALSRDVARTVGGN